jgi:hypothetical protein
MGMMPAMISCEKKGAKDIRGCARRRERGRDQRKGAGIPQRDGLDDECRRSLWCSGVKFLQPGGGSKAGKKGEKRAERGGLIGGLERAIAAREEWGRWRGGRGRARESRGWRLREILIGGLHLSVGETREGAYPFGFLPGWAMGCLQAWARMAP